MKTLDENLLNKITYQPDCQATFRKYRGKLLEPVLIATIAPAVIYVLLFLIYLVMWRHFWVFMLLFFSIGFSTSLIFLASLPVAFKDLKAKELIIETDVFLKGYTLPDPKAKAVYEGDFENAGRIIVPPVSIGGLKPNEKVYIVKAKHTNFILDIVPVDKMKD